jgi:cytochrome c peroxidase
MNNLINNTSKIHKYASIKTNNILKLILRRYLLINILLFILLLFTQCTKKGTSSDLGILLFLGLKTDDTNLRSILSEYNVTALPDAPHYSAELLHLGEALFYEKEISGGRNISCATCHHPSLVSGDSLSQPIGVNGTGIGLKRVPSPGTPLVARNAPELHNRDLNIWSSMFWDGRVSIDSSGSVHTPAGIKTPTDLSGVLAAQAIFPMTSRTEMLGAADDGSDSNELADFDPDSDPDLIWTGITSRLKAIPGYIALFSAAYPDVLTADINISHIGNAIAAYEGHFWNTLEASEWTMSDFNRYLEGDDSALNTKAKNGAFLFFGKAGCASCHNGPLLSDQKFHNIAVPQLGPDMDTDPYDRGRYRITGKSEDMFAFRTPALRESEYTWPYLHNGTFISLEKVIEHHLNPADSLAGYSSESNGVTANAVNLYKGNQTINTEMLSVLSPELKQGIVLTADENAELIEFLKSLSSPTTLTLGSKVPSSVPSGLPID